MKFRNPSFIFVRKNGQRDSWTDTYKAICPFNCFKVGGIIYKNSGEQEK